MDSNILNITAILIVSFTGLWQSIRVIMDRRIVKGSTFTLQVLQLAIGVSIFSQLIEKREYFMLLILAVVFLIGAIYFFFGTRYTVYVNNKKLLAQVIESSIVDIENLSVEKEEVDKKTKFVIPGTRKAIELVESESIISQRESYEIRFKRWFNYESQREIIHSLENSLKDEDDFEHNKVKTTFAMIFWIIIIFVCSFMASTMVIEPMRIYGVVEGVPPKEIYFENMNVSYDNIDLITKLHKNLEGSFASRRDKSGVDRVLNSSEISFKYGDKGQTFYISYNKVYMIVDHEKIGEKSIIHWICWKVHSIRDRSGISYYEVYSGRQVIDEILEDIDK